MPVFRRKNDWPKLGVWRIELEGNRIISRGGVFHADDPAALLHVILRIDQLERLPHVQVKREFHQPAVSIHDLREAFMLLPFALGIFRDDKKAHAQHHAFTAPAVHGIRRGSHDFRSDEILP